MKKMIPMIHLPLVVMTGLMLIVSSGCTYGLTGVKGDGNVVTRERDISSFTGLDVGGAFRVYLTQGTSHQLKIETDENLHDLIRTEVKGGTLHISTTSEIRDFSALNVFITFVELDEMDISGACRLTGENRTTFRNIDLDFSGASKVDLEMEAGKIHLDISGASQAEIEGNAEEMKLDASGASHMDCRSLSVRKLETDISGASHVTIHVSDELSADVSGASSFRYAGDPRIVYQDVSGAGSMKRLN
ncbi:MAG: DUF2807 domain-containing protein [Bacteroidales bacterium]|nr:DUF2807 domain-containing protein [Bacteroidales bacterium]